MEPMRFSRRLRLHDLEAFQVREGFSGPTICFLLIVDHGRPSRLDDFPFLKGIEDPEEFGGVNYIQVIVLSERQLSKEEREEIIKLAGMFLEAEGGRDWNTVFEMLPAEQMRRMEVSRLAMHTQFERILQKHGFPPVDLANIGEERFSRLSQD